MELNNEPVWGLTTAERELVKYAKSKVCIPTMSNSTVVIHHFCTCFKVSIHHGAAAEFTFCFPDYDCSLHCLA